MIQRFLDILLSLIACLLLLPIVFLPTILILKFTGEKEVFYRQARIGSKGKPFNLLKFATMVKNSPNLGSGEITLKDDPRVLPVGKFLKTKINELPQLFNILKGDMSIVGPRPMVPKTYELYPEKAKEKLNTLRPGLTGLGSIIFRDEEAYLDGSEDPKMFYEKQIIPYKSDLEVWYVTNNSLALYIKIIIITAWVIIFPKSDLASILLPNLPKKPDSLIID